MNASPENPSDADRRLRSVIAHAELAIEPELYWWDETPTEMMRPDAIAYVRDRHSTSQLVPLSHADQGPAAMRVWSFHFPDGRDDIGFMGWLATSIKRATGSGAFVVCGSNQAAGGIYHYWGCPAEVGNEVLAHVDDLRRSSPLPTLDGRRFRVVDTTMTSAITADTLFRFRHSGDLVTARYSGGPIAAGFLAGVQDGGRVVFAYQQVDRAGRVEDGQSTASITIDEAGALTLVEDYQWADGATGTNVLRETT